MIITGQKEERSRKRHIKLEGINRIEIRLAFEVASNYILQVKIL